MGKRRDGLPAPGGKISVVVETDETSPNEVTLSLYRGKTFYNEGNISIAASIMPLSSIAAEIENQDETGLHRDEILRQTQQFIKLFHLLENSGENGPTKTFTFILQTPGAVAH